MKHYTALVLTALLVACGGRISGTREIVITDPPTDAGIALECMTTPGLNACALCECTVGTWTGRQWCTPDGEPRGPCIDTTDPLAAAKRFARAVCACGDGWDGCYANVVSEVYAMPAACLNAMAAGYEVDCSGRSGPHDCVAFAR